MKKYEQKILFYMIPLILCIGYLTFFGPEISWSENALRYLNSILNAALAGMSIVFTIVSDEHEQREVEIYKWWATEIRFKHLSFFTAVSFAFDCLHPTWRNRAGGLLWR